MISKPCVLIIDDEEKLRKLLARVIGLEGFEVFEAGDAKSAWKKLEREDIDVVLCDVKLPDSNGIELTAEIKAKYPSLEIIILTAYGNIPDSVKAIKNLAFDYITKGDDNDKIIPLIHRAVEKAQLQKRVKQLEKQIAGNFTFEKINGKSIAIRDAVALAEKVAPTNTTVLLLGETGTGKEVFAEAIHFASERKLKPFVAVNCSAISRELLENELFGHKAGSYTGANKETKGVFQEANGGTIFLDEIGEMNPDLQAKLLRVLETGEFMKVGDSHTTKVNVRIIAATNRDLQKESESGHFRLDLYYRLSVFQITLPNLKDRIEDIEELAQVFCRRFAAKANKRIDKISEEYLKKLKTHFWKGNIRELKNIIERSVILTDKDTLLPDTLPLEMQQTVPKSSNGASCMDLEGMEKEHIRKILLLNKGNKTKSAEMLGIGLTTLYRKLEEYGI